MHFKFCDESSNLKRSICSGLLPYRLVPAEREALPRLESRNAREDRRPFADPNPIHLLLIPLPLCVHQGNVSSESNDATGCRSAAAPHGCNSDPRETHATFSARARVGALCPSVVLQVGEATQRLAQLQTYARFCPQHASQIRRVNRTK